MARSNAVWGIDLGQCALPPLRARAGFLRVPLQRLVGLQERPLREHGPHQLHGVVVTTAASGFAGPSINAKKNPPTASMTRTKTSAPPIVTQSGFDVFRSIAD